MLRDLKVNTEKAVLFICLSNYYKKQIYIIKFTSEAKWSNWHLTAFLSVSFREWKRRNTCLHIELL